MVKRTLACNRTNGTAYRKLGVSSPKCIQNLHATYCRVREKVQRKPILHSGNLDAGTNGANDSCCRGLNDEMDPKTPPLGGNRSSDERLSVVSNTRHRISSYERDPAFLSLLRLLKFLSASYSRKRRTRTQKRQVAAGNDRVHAETTRNSRSIPLPLAATVY